jgi:DNA-binding response OmpR family regulator
VLRLNGIRLLIVDKDGIARNTMKSMAQAAGYAYDEAADGITAIKLFRRHDYHVIILDIELPELDGLNVCRQIRKVSDVPILVVSEKDGETDRLCAFETGVDDFVKKPFSPNELMARIKVFLYRTGGVQRAVPAKITFNGLFIDTISRCVYIEDSAVSLTPKEYDLLYFLSQNPNKAFSREMLLSEVWGQDFVGTDRTIDTHIKTLRENIRPYDNYIVTVWGFGYKFVYPAPESD